LETKLELLDKEKSALAPVLENFKEALAFFKKKEEEDLMAFSNQLAQAIGLNLKKFFFWCAPLGYLYSFSFQCNSNRPKPKFEPKSFLVFTGIATVKIFEISMHRNF
jgi:hypothetical protein